MNITVSAWQVAILIALPVLASCNSARNSPAPWTTHSVTVSNQAQLTGCGEKSRGLLGAAEAPIHFDDAPEFDDVIPGSVTVLFHDRYNVRGSGSTRTLSTDHATTQAELNRLLHARGLVHVMSSSQGESEVASRRREEQSERVWQADVPNSKSIHVLQFPDSADARSIASQLRQLPYVRTAYRTPRFQTASVTNVVKWTNSNLAGPKTTDNRFNGPYANYEKEFWSWYNRHRAFDAWIYFNNLNISKPTIAVVDSGFKTDSGPDLPIYLAGQSFDDDGDPIGTDVSNPSNHSVSHGSYMTHLIGSPSSHEVSNSNYFAGSAPGASIVPVKAATYSGSSDGSQFYPLSVAAAIRYAAGQAETVNVSIQAGGYPIVWDTNMRAAVADATASGVTVVICAGNRRHNLDASYPNTDAGAIIVGGSHRDNGENWRNNNVVVGNEGAGTNYGTPIHLTASAYQVGVFTWSPSLYYLGWNMHTKDGTSFSAAIVSGAAGAVRQILKARDAQLTGTALRDKVEEILWGSATIRSGLINNT